jgi:flotillin
MTNQIVLIVGLGVLALIFLMGILARMYRKAGPNEALIVYGFRGPRVIKGHGTVIFPMVENCRELSLELTSFDVAPQQDLYTKQGVVHHQGSPRQERVHIQHGSARHCPH